MQSGPRSETPWRAAELTPALGKQKEESTICDAIRFLEIGPYHKPQYRGSMLGRQEQPRILRMCLE